MSPVVELIILFLEVNPKPSDKQVHCLAESLGIDKETLEAVMYRMLSCATREERTDYACAMELKAATRVEEVLDGDYDPAVTPPDLLIMNDGDIDDPDPGFQEELLDDGLPADDPAYLADQQDTLNDGGIV